MSKEDVCGVMEPSVRGMSKEDVYGVMEPIVPGGCPKRMCMVSWSL